MNSILRTVLIVIGILAIAAVFVAGGVFIGQQTNSGSGYGFNRSTSTGLFSGFFNRFCGSANYRTSDVTPFFGRGMMGNFSRTGTSRGYRMGAGMMGGFFSKSTSTTETLSVEAARSAVNDYLSSLNNNDLSIKEIMVFDRKAYAVVVEKSTGMGAMELLVDPVTLQVFPEYGPNRMWNLKYGMMVNGGCMFGWNNSNTASNAISADMTISLEEAKGIAGDYLTGNISEAEIEGEGSTFYGYYTFDYSENGQVAGMLSVNGFSGQIWEHTWHGQFIEEWELEE